MSGETLPIRTAEGVTFSVPLAGPTARFLAWLVDSVLALALTMVGAAGIGAALAFVPDLAQALSIVAFFVVQVGYNVAGEWWWHGQTPGKRLFNLRVMDAAALRLRFGQVLVRNLLRAVDALPAAYLVGGISCMATRRVQRLGDLAAHTVVVRVPREALPDYQQMADDSMNSLLRHPHLAARLRQRTSPEEAQAALQAVLRRGEFDPEARVQLFREMTDHFQRLVRFPAEAVEGLTDEAYLRAVVAILFGSGRKRERRSGSELS